MPGPDVQCFIAERLDEAQRSFRRYVSKRQDCPLPHGYHNASVVVVEREPFVSEWEGDGVLDPDKADPRWPAACACGYVFQDEDMWQVNRDRLYRDPRDGSVHPSHKLPPGAMRLIDWDSWKGPDGRTLIVTLPDSTDWRPDGIANNAKNPDGTYKLPGWTRTGTPPLVTCTPSIKTSRYHGFLTNGVLRACGDSET